MADPMNIDLSWRNVVIGIVCVVAANLLLALIEIGGPLPGPHWIWSSIATGVAVAVWFFIAARLRK